ncbi:MAG: hypothetical protein WAX44_02900 [Minisyncoccia bacterium]
MNTRPKKIKLDERPLAVVEKDGEVWMIVREDKKSTSTLSLIYSDDGIDFVSDNKKVTIKNLKGRNETIKNCDRFSVSRTPNGYVMTYVRLGSKRIQNMLVVARSKDLYEWKALSELPVDEFHHTTTVYDKKRDKFDLYRDGLFIKHQSSTALTIWKEKPTLVFTSRHGLFDSQKISIIGSLKTREGVLLIYDASVEVKNKTLLQAGAVIFDKDDPKKILWRSAYPIWQGVVETKKEALPIEPLGIVSLGNVFVIYWISKDGGLIVIKIPALFKDIEENRFLPRILNRFTGNPIIEPRGHYDWEGEGTFNPAAFEDDEGMIHLLYRAVGRDGISRVGYAKSKDGRYFTNRLSFPIFEQLRNYSKKDDELMEYSPVMFTSGGSWTGAEDPRTVRIGKRVYMIYVVFDGWRSVPRLALTSISLEDFKAGRWEWKKPIKISPPNHFYKNWLLFPEKINGKFAIIHSIEPNVLIEYVDKFENLEGKYVNSRHPEDQKERVGWDTKIRGSGPPPVRTELGWLLLYHATQKHEPHRYKVGAMILDLKDPTKVLYRSKHPILAPDMHYENNGKPGVVYASGAVIKGDDLHVYYGGADKVVCVATTPIKKFLHYLVTGNTEHYKFEKV